MKPIAPPSPAGLRPRTSLPRGVHRSRYRRHGEYLFIAVAGGYVLDQHRPRADETEDDVILALFAVVDRADPPRRARAAHLRLLRDAVASAPATPVTHAPRPSH